MNMKVFKHTELAELPEFATEGSACFDLKACFAPMEFLKSYNAWNKEAPIVAKERVDGVHAIKIPPEQRVLIPTGLIFDIPKDHVLKMYVRSSVALKKGLTLANSTGIIDSDYVDPLFVVLHNVSDTLVLLKNGERIAQGMLQKTLKYSISETKTKPEQKTDRDGGLGSTN
mgnify:CR=1 FL=1